jgi:hypothetical protein
MSALLGGSVIVSTVTSCGWVVWLSRTLARVEPQNHERAET